LSDGYKKGLQLDGCTESCIIDSFYLSKDGQAIVQHVI